MTNELDTWKWKKRNSPLALVLLLIDEEAKRKYALAESDF